MLPALTNMNLKNCVGVKGSFKFQAFNRGVGILEESDCRSGCVEALHRDVAYSRMPVSIRIFLCSWCSHNCWPNYIQLMHFHYHVSPVNPRNVLRKWIFLARSEDCSAFRRF
jgi:hypothetical protein